MKETEAEHPALPDVPDLPWLRFSSGTESASRPQPVHDDDISDKHQMPMPADTLYDAGGTELLLDSVLFPTAVSENDAIDDNPVVVESAGATAIDGVGFGDACDKFPRVSPGLSPRGPADTN